MLLYLTGMIEMVPEAETLRKIQIELGLTGSFKDQPIAQWLTKHNPSALEYERAVANFTGNSIKSVVVSGETRNWFWGIGGPTPRVIEYFPKKARGPPSEIFKNEQRNIYLPFYVFRHIYKVYKIVFQITFNDIKINPIISTTIP